MLQRLRTRFQSWVASLNPPPETSPLDGLAMELYTDTARSIVRRAEQIAKEHSQKEVSSAFIVLALIDANAEMSTAIFDRYELNQADLRSKILETIVSGEVSVGDEEASEKMAFSPGAVEVFYRAMKAAYKTRSYYIGSEHLVLGLLHEQHQPELKPLQAVGLSEDAVLQTVVEMTTRD